MTEQLDGLVISRQGEPATVLLMPSMGHKITRVLYEVFYSYSGYSVSSSYKVTEIVDCTAYLFI